MASPPDKRSGKGGRFLAVFAVAMVVLFLGGIAMLFDLRFRDGDVYPPGSSLRADPLGTRAFYESLEEIPGMEVMRNIEPYRRLEGEEGRSLLLIGASRQTLRKRRGLTEVESLQAFAEAGGRVAIAISPQRTFDVEAEEDADEDEGEEDEGDEEEKGEEESEEDSKEKETEEKVEEEEVEEKDSKKKDSEEAEEEEEWDEDEEMVEMGSLVESWDFGFDWREEDKPEGGWKLRRTKSLAGLANRDLPRWQGDVVLEELGAEWEVLARAEKMPVLARRVFGEGEVIIASDAYFASNEALVNQRSTKFLAWFAGEGGVVVFDETHLGSRHQRNIMQLVGRYRLHGFFVGLGLFVLLLAWRSSSSLLPGDDELGMGISMRHEVSGQDSATGFRRMLRRSIATGDLLETCFTVWNEQRGRQARAFTEGQLERVREVIAEEKNLPPPKRAAAEAYNRIAAILAERN